MLNHHKGACLCGLNNDYIQCCGRFIKTGYLPEYPEQLMRSRYTAYVLNDHEYLLETWHERTRPNQLQLDPEIHWMSLTIINHQNNKEIYNEGWVEFVAHYRNNDHPESLHERSRFLREDGHWLYVDGHIFPQSPEEKISRNALCPCGSGKKFKHCCID